MYFDLKEFGARLKKIRESRGLTQDQLADRLGVVKHHISRMKRGIEGCSIDLLIDLSCVLNTSTDYLLMGKESNADGIKEQLSSVMSQLSSILQEM